MTESERLLDRGFFDKVDWANLMFPLGWDGMPTYGTVSVGSRQYDVVSGRVFRQGTKIVEILELESGETLRGRSVEIL
jgi:hypothetical protein